MKITTLENALQNVSGASFVGIDTIVDVKLRGGKSNPMQGRVTKLTAGSQVMVFQNKKVNGYEAMVRRRLEAEGKEAASFELKPRSWGQRRDNSPIVDHEKDGVIKHYLEVIFLRAGETQYFLDKQPIDETNITGLDTAGEATGQAGLENKVAIRSYGVDSILCLRVDGKTFQ